MELDGKKLLYQFAEDTAYSSKGHFKTADWVKASLSFYIAIPLTTSLLLLLFYFPDLLQRILSFFGFLFSSFALSSTLSNNREKAQEKVEGHMELGNKYLEAHKKIKIMIANRKYDHDSVEKIKKEICALDKKTHSLHISLAGRWWSKMNINREMNIGWIYKK